jgi:hypothetical protein
MKLRFNVNQAEAFRLGVEVPKSIVTVEVNPADLPQEQRELIADRMEGIDVCKLWGPDRSKSTAMGKYKLTEAKLPTFEALIEAILLEETLIKQSTTKVSSKAA